MMNILPEFESRQVLTSDELNWLTSYLDSQNRLSRKLLLGCGVIGGLQIESNMNPDSITITNGCAVTSAGHIVSLQNEGDTTTFTKRKKYTQKEKERLAFPYLIDNKEGEQDYSNSVNSPSIYFNEFKNDVYELFEGTYNDASLLKANEVKGKVVMAFAEIIQTELKDCEEDNCQDKGKKYTFKTKILLISKEDALRLLNIQFQLASEEEEAISKKAFPWLYIASINILKPAFSNLNTTKGINEAVIIQEYKRCINHLAQTLERNRADIDNGLNGLTNFISNKENSFSFAESLLQLIGKMDISGKNQKIYVAQVSYDYLWTIIKAYQEIQHTAQGLRAKCMIKESAFPNHALLGIIKATENWQSTITLTEEIYRHPFYSQYTQTEQALLCRKISFQFNRLHALLNNFDDEIFNKVYTTRLTPGASLFEPLSLQAIPYYLKSEITNTWNQNADHPYLKLNTTYYHHADDEHTDSANIYNKQPLSFQGPSSFFRIEGVLGRNALDALNHVFKIRKTNGLPYEVIMLRLNENTPVNHSFNFSVNEDIESIYQVVRAELLKQINLNVSYISGLLFKQGKFQEMKTSLGELLAMYYEKEHYKSGISQVQYYSSPMLTAVTHQNANAFSNLQYQATLSSHQQLSHINLTLLNMDFLLPSWIFIQDSFGNLIDGIKKEERFKSKSELSFYSHLLAISKSEVRGQELFYKTLRLYSALRLQDLSLTENFLEFNAEAYSKNLNDELLKACDAIIPYLKQAKSDFIKSDAILTEVVKGEMLDYADRIKFDDDWIKMNQIDIENKKRNGGLGLENLFERFIHFHPGITHGCGVPKGGTFIMVYDERNEVTANFYLPYIISSTLRPIQYTLLEAPTEIEINHTTTVRFFDQNKQQINTDIPLTSTTEESLIAEQGLLKVSGTPSQQFTYTVNKGDFNKKSFTVTIKDKDTTQDVSLTAINKEIIKDTWVISDFHFDEKSLKDLTVSLNGTKIKVTDKAHTQNYQLNYNKETLIIHLNNANSIAYTTDKIPLPKINAVIVFLKDEARSAPPIKEQTRDSSDTKVPTETKLEKREFFTFTKAFMTSEVSLLFGLHSGFQEIPLDSVLVKNNFYCLLLTASERKNFQATLNL